MQYTLRDIEKSNFKYNQRENVSRVFWQYNQ